MTTFQQKPIMLITGANSGIGKATALTLAKMNMHVIMLCRDQQRGEIARQEIITHSGNQNIDLYTCDLSSLTSIRQFVATFNAHHDHLDVLINNAAVITRERQESQDGYELQFAVNHLAPFLLTNLLLAPLNASSQPARIVNVTSIGHHFGKINFADLQSSQRYRFMHAYAQSKLANILFTYELARRLQGTGITVNCVHPGHIKTNISVYTEGGITQFLFTLFQHFYKTPDQGADTSVYLATSTAVQGITGHYFTNRKTQKTSPASYNLTTAHRLWTTSSQLTNI